MCNVENVWMEIEENPVGMIEMEIEDERGTQRKKLCLLISFLRLTATDQLLFWCQEIAIKYLNRLLLLVWQIGILGILTELPTFPRPLSLLSPVGHRLIWSHYQSHLFARPHVFVSPDVFFFCWVYCFSFLLLFFVDFSAVFPTYSSHRHTHTHMCFPAISIRFFFDSFGVCYFAFIWQTSHVT